MVDAYAASDHGDYFRMLSRMLRAAGRRVGDADPSDLALLVQLSDELAEITQAAVTRQRESFSWAQIAEPLGVTRQAVEKRWGRPERRRLALEEALRMGQR